jgi:hypothetical protein
MQEENLMAIFTALPPGELFDEEKIRLVDEVLNQDFNELSEAEKRGFYTRAIAEGLKPDWPLQPEKLFTRDAKLKTLFPNLVEEKKIMYVDDFLDIIEHVFPMPASVKSHLRQLPKNKLIDEMKKILEMAPKGIKF